MYLSDISFQFNLLFKEIQLPTLSPDDNISIRHPDDVYADLVARQLEALQKQLQTELPLLEKKYALSTMYAVCTQFEKIAKQAKALLNTRKSKKRISQTHIQNILNRLRMCSECTNELRLKLIEKQRAIKAHPVRAGMGKRMFSSMTGTLASIAQRLLTSGSPQWLEDEIKNYERKLFDCSNSHIAANVAHMMGKMVTTMLEDELIHASKKDVLVRKTFLRELLYDDTAATPTPNALGSALISVIQTRRQLVEKLVAVNVMKGMLNIYEHLHRLKKNKPEFLAAFINSCIGVGLGQIEETKKVEEEGLPYAIGETQRRDILNKSTPKDIGASILKIAFPGGYKDLIFISPSLVQGQFTPQLFDLIKNVLSDTLYDTFTEMGKNTVLKDSLHLEGMRAIQTAIQKKGSVNIRRGVNLMEVLIDPERPALVGAGVVLVFFKVMFSTLGEVFHTTLSALSITDRKKKKKDVSIEQKNLNKSLMEVFSLIAQESNSRLFKAAFRLKGRAFVEALGDQLMEKLKKESLSELFTQQLKSMLENILAPGGRWSGSTYTGDPVKTASTVQEVQGKEKKKEKAQSDLRKEVEKVRKDLGKDISGLIDKISSYIELKPKIDDSEDAPRFKKTLALIERKILSFANACIHKCIVLSSYILRVDRLIQGASVSIDKKMQALQQDSFIIAISEYLNREIYGDACPVQA